MRKLFATAAIVALLTGCSSTSPHLSTARPSEPQNSQGGSSLTGGDMNYEAEDGEQVLMPRILLTRQGGFSGGLLTVKITPAGRYQISYRDANNTHSSEGQLTKDQRKAIIAAFKGWEDLKPEYLPRNGTADDYTIALTYNGKTVTGSDAAELPPTVVRAYGTLRNRISSFPAN
jgi:hypothetical protein